MKSKSEEVVCYEPVSEAVESNFVDVTGSSFTDDEILEIIQKLDKELGTKDYLPLFHLREKLQEKLSRNELDQVLFQLQADDKIELSTLQEAKAYTPEQIESGIEQTVGGPLFFISVY